MAALKEPVVAAVKDNMEPFYCVFFAIVTVE